VSAVVERSHIADGRSAEAAARAWLARFDAALAHADATNLAALFAPDGHWRDVLAFTWTLTATEGARDIGALLAAKQPSVKAQGFSLAHGRTPPRALQRAGSDVIEAIVEFETAAGRGHGVLRLLAHAPEQAYQLMTALDELKGHEEKIGKRRPTGEAYSRNFGGSNWKEQREAAQAYADREPTVLVVGGGQAGLGLAATLGRLDVDTLVVDRLPRVGDCWRTRYHSLALHNNTEYNHMPYMPFPPSWPTYLPKDMIADWFETYAWAMEINFWPGTEFLTASFDEASRTWRAVVRRADGSERVLRPRHIVMANGLVGFPSIPALPGLDRFRGDRMHTSEFSTGARWRGRKALIIGTGTSAHDIAQDLHANGCDATLVQRGETMVISIDPSAKLSYGIYQGIALEDGDLLSMTNTFPVLKKNLQLLTRRMVEYDREMIDALQARGFKWTMGEDGAGHQMMIRRRYGGYYLDAGCAALIIKGEVGLLQFDRIERFVENGALLKDGSVREADLIVLATGFVSQEAVVAKHFGEAVAKRVGPVWGIGPDGEMNNMWKRSPQDGLWFIGGSFAQCRNYSKYVALQLKAIEAGLMPRA
jgi:putative flavoprotein involved in K+ transport